MNNINVNVDEDKNYIPSFYDNLNTKGAESLKAMFSGIFEKFDPINTIILFALLAFFIFIFSNLGSQPQQVETSSGGKFILLLFISLLIVLLITNTFQYLFKFDVKGIVKKIFSPHTEVEVELKKKKHLKNKKSHGKGKTDSNGSGSGLDGDSDGSGSGSGSNSADSDGSVSSMNSSKQVFHIPGNKYTYCDAKSVCKAFGSRLATYNEIEKAYKDGAEWCSYGWSDDQLALFPTQKSTFKKLKNKKGHEHDCGRPGINGGFIKNQNVKFGANCFGFKPEITPEEQKSMSNVNIIPMTKEQKHFEEKVKYYKSKLGDILISPFNKKQWSKV